MSIEIQDLDQKVPWPVDDYMTPASKRGPPPFDFERLIRFMAYGFMMAPVQHKWFGLLQRLFPIENGKGTANAFRRVAFDQFIFAPIGMPVCNLRTRNGADYLQVSRLSSRS